VDRTEEGLDQVGVAGGCGHSSTCRECGLQRRPVFLEQRELDFGLAAAPANRLVLAGQRHRAANFQRQRRTDLCLERDHGFDQDELIDAHRKRIRPADGDGTGQIKGFDGCCLHRSYFVCRELQVKVVQQRLDSLLQRLLGSCAAGKSRIGASGQGGFLREADPEARGHGCVHADLQRALQRTGKPVVIGADIDLRNGWVGAEHLLVFDGEARECAVARCLNGERDIAIQLDLR